MIAGVTMAFQNAATTGEGVTQFLLEPRTVRFSVTGNGSVSAGAVTINPTRVLASKYARARIAAEMSPNEPFFELYRRKTLAAARRSLAIVSALVG